MPSGRARGFVQRFPKELLPTADGYATTENVYWADSEEIAGIFSNVQLAFLSGNPKARWVFRSIVRSSNKYKEYIDIITDQKWCDKDAIIKGRVKCWSFVYENSINFQNRIQRAEENSQKEVDRNAREQELSDQLVTIPKYT